MGFCTTWDPSPFPTCCQFSPQAGEDVFPCLPLSFVASILCGQGPVLSAACLQGAGTATELGGGGAEMQESERHRAVNSSDEDE